jgi:hypothetical protein
LLVVTSSFRNIVILLTSLKIQNSETATNRRIKSIRSFTNYKMMKIVIFVVIAILGYVQAEWVRMEPSVTVFSGRHWRKLGKTDEDAPVKVVFALKHNQNTIQQLDQKLMEVSNPSSRNYGKYMTVNFFGLSFSFFLPLGFRTKSSPPRCRLPITILPSLLIISGALESLK